MAAGLLRWILHKEEGSVAELSLQDLQKLWTDTTGLLWIFFSFPGDSGDCRSVDCGLADQELEMHFSFLCCTLMN